LQGGVFGAGRRFVYERSNASLKYGGHSLRYMLIVTHQWSD
jgi:hypothetical protein